MILTPPPFENSETKGAVRGIGRSTCLHTKYLCSLFNTYIWNFKNYKKKIMKYFIRVVQIVFVLIMCYKVVDDGLRLENVVLGGLLIAVGLFITEVILVLGSDGK